MIKLDAALVTTFSYLAKPPTHASLVQRRIAVGEGQELYVEYALGIVTDAGFVADTKIPHIQWGILQGGPNDAVFQNLIGAGKAPDPTDPSKSIDVPSKQAGDCKIADLDAVVAKLSPDLKGTVV